MSKNVQTFQNQTSNSQNYTNKVVNKISLDENKIAYSKQSPNQDKAIIEITKPVREIKTSKTDFIPQEQMKTKQPNDMIQKGKKLEDWTRYPENNDVKPEHEKEITIPVQNYKSSRPAASLPARRESIGPSFDKKKRRKSLSTYSKTSTASRSYAGCSIA
jgi:hypothetical protein